MGLKSEGDAKHHAPEEPDEAYPCATDDRAGTKPHWLDQLYRVHRHRLQRYARRYLQDDRSADIVQQVFARLATRPPEALPAIEMPDAYLHRMARNLIRDDARAARRRSAPLHVCDEDALLAGPDPVAHLEARDTLARLEAVVAALDVRTREIFLAHRIDGLSYREIAAKTGPSVKTVEKHMSRAIASIARHLDAS